MNHLFIFKNKIEELQEHVTFLKGVNRQTRSAEIRLQRKLVRLMEEVEEETIRQVLRLERLSDDDLTIQAILNKFQSIDDKYNELLIEDNLEAAQRGKNRIINRLQKQGMSVGFNKISERIVDNITNQTFEASARTLNRLRGNLMDNILEAYKQGLGIDETVELIRYNFVNIKEYELVRIARTEINSNQNLAAHQSMRELGVEYKRWITAQDERVRDGTTSTADHVSMHGQIVPIDEPFSNGLYHPGDRSGDISEWINCRCTEIPYIIPSGFQVPTGLTWFYEQDLVPVS